MITFGYKNRFSGFVRALLALAVGVVMVVSKTNALELAVRIIAAFLVATGIVTFFLGLKAKQNGQASLLSVNAIVDVVLGILLALLAFGLFQIISLVSIIRVAQVKAWSFIMPCLVVVAGGFLISKPSFIGEAIGIVAGVALIVYGASELLSTWKMRKVIDEYENQVDEQ